MYGRKLVWSVAALSIAACGETEEPFEIPEPPPTGYQLLMPAVEIAPGEDIEFCTYFNLDDKAFHDANGQPFLLKDLITNGFDPTAEEIAIGKIEVRGAPGLHHIQILAMENDLEDIDDRHIFECAVDLFGGPLTGDVDPLFFTSLNNYAVEYPEGVARVLKRVQNRDDETQTRGTQLLYNFHYLNTTTEPITAEVVVNLHVVPRETVEHPVRSAWWNYIYFEAEPDKVSRVEAKGSFLVDVNLVGMTSHLHEMGRRFTYAIDDELVYDDKNWAEPEYKRFDDGTVLAKDNPIEFTCEWYNSAATPRYFGLQADDEMCTAIVEYYPVDEAEAEALLEQQRMDAEMNGGGGPFRGDIVTLERFLGFPEELIQEISERPEDAFEILDSDIICGIAFNLKQMERQYGSSPEILTSLQGLLEFLEEPCRL
ncbi:MAG: hypothetical protein RIT81_23770 [Deltaproteobacteria bacterium]